ncbi:MAG: hypothetical protein GF334_05725, partial [Candidatus Altiarchaeales archaeon]|nr:hypothetical protein [Candidatus Altiarchaeales archaeon]
MINKYAILSSVRGLKKIFLRSVMTPQVIAENREFLRMKNAQEEKKSPEKAGGEDASKLRKLIKAVQELKIPTHNSTLNRAVQKLQRSMVSHKSSPRKMREALLELIETWKKVNVVDKTALERKKKGKGKDKDEKKSDKGDEKKEKEKEEKPNKKTASTELVEGLIHLANNNPDMRTDLLEILRPVSPSSSLDSTIIRFAYENPQVRRPILTILETNYEEFSGNVRTASEKDATTFLKLRLAAEMITHLREDFERLLNIVSPPEVSLESRIVRYAYENPAIRVPLLDVLELAAQEEKFESRLASDVNSRIISRLIRVAYTSPDRIYFLPLIMDLCRDSSGVFAKFAADPA